MMMRVKIGGRRIDGQSPDRVSDADGGSAMADDLRFTQEDLNRIVARETGRLERKHERLLDEALKEEREKVRAECDAEISSLTDRLAQARAEAKMAEVRREVAERVNLWPFRRR
jgi:hypothetical protein